MVIRETKQGPERIYVTGNDPTEQCYYRGRSFYIQVLTSLNADVFPDGPILRIVLTPEIS